MKLDKKTLSWFMLAAGAIIAFGIIYLSRNQHSLVMSNTPSQGPVVKLRNNPELGDYQAHLTDSRGLTLYISLGECKDRCMDDWIPYIVNPNIPVDTSDPVQKKLGTMQIYFDEKGQPTYRQYTYLGHPLYYFKGDRNVGAINGHNIANGNWVVVLLNTASK